MKETKCIGCGGVFPDTEGPTHRYLESSPGCWAAYCEVLALEYSNPAYAADHCFTVDAYAVQHPGRPSPQTIQSEALHLIRLCLTLQEGCTCSRAIAGMKAAARNKAKFYWLEPPPSRGGVTVLGVRGAASADEHGKLVRRWAEASWAAWSEHHGVIRQWLPTRW